MYAGVVKLVDTPGLGPGALWSYRFESCHPYGDVVQLVERMLCTHKVIGSNPIVSISRAQPTHGDLSKTLVSKAFFQRRHLKMRAPVQLQKNILVQKKDVFL